MNQPKLPNLGRRGFLGTTAAVAGAGALAACGGPSTSSSDTKSKSKTDYSKVKPAKTIEFWSNHPGKSQDVEQKIVDAFNASQSDTKVTLVTAGASYEDVAAKFQTAQAGGGLPGVVVLSDVWWFRFKISDATISLDGLLDKAKIDSKKYQDTLWGDYTYEGEQWAIPYSRSTPLFYYNKAHWKAAGLEDRAPKTWEEFADWQTKLKAANLNVPPFMHGAIENYAGWTFQNLLWGEGGGYSKKWDITIDDDIVVKQLTKVKEQVASGLAGISSKDQGDDFSAGACSATMTSTGSLVGIAKTAQFEFGVGFLPGGSKATDKVCPTGGAGLGIPKKISKEEQLAAANFIAFATNAKNSADFSLATGYMPVRKDADTDAIIAANPKAKTALDQLPHTRSQDYARVFLPGGDKIIGDSFGLVVTQGQDAKTTLKTAKTSLEQVYTSQVKPNLK